MTDKWFNEFKKHFLQLSNKERAEYRRFVLGDWDCTSEDLEWRFISTNDSSDNRIKNIYFHWWRRWWKSFQNRKLIELYNKMHKKNKEESFKVFSIPWIHFNELSDDSYSEYKVDWLRIWIDYWSDDDQDCIVVTKKVWKVIEVVWTWKDFDDIIHLFPKYESIKLSESWPLFFTPKKKKWISKLIQKFKDWTLFF